MNSNLCKVCNRSLNESQRKALGSKNYKSCPRCSTENREEHVYYEYPEYFGTSSKRSTANNPDGPQSYCTSCRGNTTPVISDSKLCREF